MKDKYLRKNEFRDYENPKYLSKSGKPHPAYITVKHKRKLRANVITHSSSFFGEETIQLKENPNRNENKSVDIRQTRLSKPFWDNEKNFSKTKKKGWRLSKKDKKSIKKWNKKNQP